MRPVLRYPGAKPKLAESIMRLLPIELCSGIILPAPAGSVYIEPFFGSGAAGFHFLKRMNKEVSVWINDIDYSIYALWSAVVNHPEELQSAIKRIRPSVELFFQLKQSDGVDTGDIVRDAVGKIALHRMSMSGFGAMSGGPIGGRDQSGDYKVDARWNADSVCQAVKESSRLLNSFDDLKITRLHVQEMFVGSQPEWFYYLDPPYYVKGNELYRNGMTHQEHVALARSLKDTPAKWVLSYDDCDEVRSLYKDFKIDEMDVKYSNAVQSGGERLKSNELVIYN